MNDGHDLSTMTAKLYNEQQDIHNAIIDHVADTVTIRPVFMLDIRLCVDPFGTWTVRSGDVSYDTSHSRYCGAIQVHSDGQEGPQEAHEQVTDLIEQVLEQVAMASPGTETDVLGLPDGV